MFFQEKCDISYVRKNTETYVLITGVCVYSQDLYTVRMLGDYYMLLLLGKNIKRLIGAADMEFLISGISPKAWNKYHNIVEIDNKDIDYCRTVEFCYITNATSKSIVFFIVTYLNNQGYSQEEINKLKRDYGIQNLINNTNQFTVEELRESLAKQSAYFLSIFDEVNKNFRHFIEGLTEEKFRGMFKNYENKDKVLKNWNRKIFHNSLECSYMRKDYKEERIHSNTGVFIEDIATIEPDFYQIEREFLEKLGMRLCIPCAGLKKEA